MDDFDLFKERWKQQPTELKSPEILSLKTSNTDTLQKLRRTQLFSAVTLFLTVCVLTWMGFFSVIVFKSTLTYVGLVMVLGVVFTQSLINFSIYLRLGRLAIAASASEHLAQWEQYYSFRKRLVSINNPLYFIGLNTAMGLYFIEVLGYFSTGIMILSIVIYLAWMVFAYFVLGKRALRREYQRIENIVENLRRLQGQFNQE